MGSRPGSPGDDDGGGCGRSQLHGFGAAAAPGVAVPGVPSPHPGAGAARCCGRACFGEALGLELAPSSPRRHPTHPPPPCQPPGRAALRPARTGRVSALTAERQKASEFQGLLGVSNTHLGFRWLGKGSPDDPRGLGVIKGLPRGAGEARGRTGTRGGGPRLAAWRASEKLSVLHTHRVQRRGN